MTYALISAPRPFGGPALIVGALIESFEDDTRARREYHRRQTAHRRITPGPCGQPADEALVRVERELPSGLVAGRMVAIGGEWRRQA